MHSVQNRQQRSPMKITGKRLYHEMFEDYSQSYVKGDSECLTARSIQRSDALSVSARSKFNESSLFGNATRDHEASVTSKRKCVDPSAFMYPGH